MYTLVVPANVRPPFWVPAYFAGRIYENPKKYRSGLDVVRFHIQNVRVLENGQVVDRKNPRVHFRIPGMLWVEDHQGDWVFQNPAVDSTGPRVRV